jgi:pimeloyl-ACP methyl ester carboxylesterase
VALEWSAKSQLPEAADLGSVMGMIRFRFSLSMIRPVVAPFAAAWIVLLVSLPAAAQKGPPVAEAAPASPADPAAATSAPFGGKKSTWNGYDKYDFECGGKPALVVCPKSPAPGRPWVWHGEFFGHKPAPDIALLGKGFHVAYLRIPDMLGCPDAVKHWNAFHADLTGRCGLAKKPALVGLSRGGLYCYNWAIANPDKVACIYADAAVCDFKSWPGGKGKGKGDAHNWSLVMKLWNFASEADALAYKGNPVDSLQPLARAGVPLLHVYGDADDVVPWEENTGLVADRYRAFGGNITLIAKKGVGHHPHGLDDSTPIVDFIIRHCTTAQSSLPSASTAPAPGSTPAQEVPAKPSASTKAPDSAPQAPAPK